MALSVGAIAPPFRLPAAHGRDVALEDYRGRRHLIVWFSKGMACPFCRHQMSQLALAYPRLRGLNAEVLHITPTPVDRARIYARRFRLDFPYLSDPTFATWTAWGLALRPRSGRFLRHPDHVPPSSFGPVLRSPWEWSQLIGEEDGGVLHRGPRRRRSVRPGVVVLFARLEDAGHRRRRGNPGRVRARSRSCARIDRARVTRCPRSG